MGVFNFSLWFFYLASDKWFFPRFLRNRANGTFAFTVNFAVTIKFGLVGWKIGYVGRKMVGWLSWPKAAFITCLWINTLLYIIWVQTSLFVQFAVSHWTMETLLLLIKARWLSWKPHVFTFIWTTFLALVTYPGVFPWCACILESIAFSVNFLKIIILVLHRLNNILVDVIFPLVFCSRLHLCQRWLFCYWLFVGEVIIYMFFLGAAIPDFLGWEFGPPHPANPMTIINNGIIVRVINLQAISFHRWNNYENNMWIILL